MHHAPQTRILLALIHLVTTLALSIVAQDHVEQPLVVVGEDDQLIHGRMDWSDSFLIGYGEAVAPEHTADAVQRRLLGFRAAKTMAYHNLLELAGQVQIDSRTLVRDAMATSDTIRARVNDIVQGAQVIPGSQEEAGGLYRLELRVKLGPAFADAVLPEFPRRRPEYTVPDTLYSTAEEDTSARAATTAETLTAALFFPAHPYTGLVVDARGLGLQPSLAPRIITEDGREIYSPAFVERTYATHIGLVAYELHMAKALTRRWVGGREANPLVIEAIDAAGRYRSDPVISREDGIRVSMADAESGFLGQCRVLILVGPSPEHESAFPDTSLLESESPDTSQLDLDLLDSLSPIQGDRIGLPRQAEP